MPPLDEGRVLGVDHRVVVVAELCDEHRELVRALLVDVVDGEPEIVLDGWTTEAKHNMFNGLKWGPDGWLYGCQGSTVTADIRGVRFQQGVWRYHPLSKKFELFCDGGGNTWGLDFDEEGELLYSTNYGGHVLLHGVQGAYYWKAFEKHGPLSNPFAYGYFEHAPHESFRGGHVTVGGIVPARSFETTFSQVAACAATFPRSSVSSARFA